MEGYLSRFFTNRCKNAGNHLNICTYEMEMVTFLCYDFNIFLLFGTQEKYISLELNFMLLLYKIQGVKNPDIW